MFLFMRNFSKTLFVFAMFFVVTVNIPQTFAQVKTKDQLSQELKLLEEQIAAHKVVIQEKQKEGASLSRDLGVLDNKIKKSTLEIKLKDTAIKKLAYSIDDKNKKIVELRSKINVQTDSIKDTFAQLYSHDDANLLTLMLNSSSVSDYFDQAENYHKLENSLTESVRVIKEAKGETEKVKEELEDDKDEVEAAKSVKLSEKKNTEVLQKEKDQALKITKGQEKEYAKLLKEKELAASKVRAALFSFADGSSINFGNLYEYAKRASAATGVRTEFILAILEQESSFGSNVGQCYISDKVGNLVTMSTGASKGAMKPDSVTPFFGITDSLGRDPMKTRVSCALSYGYGGAMGMAQFMPATWAGYKSSVQSATGAAVADPWNAAHAISAMSFLLRDNKAVTDERNAACRYYSGGSCSRSTNAATYGNRVMSRILGIQAKIETLQGV
jgi:membrane-bound lytic murein transglycosylase B